MIIACLRDFGLCPCPHCLTPKSLLHQMGMKRDTARREKLARKDDDVMKEKVTTASKLIYGEY